MYSNSNRIVGVTFGTHNSIKSYRFEKMMVFTLREQSI
jgi:hypothetical protein